MRAPEVSRRWTQRKVRIGSRDEGLSGAAGAAGSKDHDDIRVQVDEEYEGVVGLAQFAAI